MQRSKLSTAALWSAFSIGATLVAVAAGVWVDYRIDLYGVFGRNNASRVIYTNERAGKYLLAMRYVPARFDALLLGTSVTDNWDTAKIGTFRVYNGSISGGNISEGKLIADNVLAVKTLRAMLFCVFPYLTETHGRKRSGMDAREFLGALGSLQLLRDYSVALVVSTGFSRPMWNEYGVFDTDSENVMSEPAKRVWWKGGGEFTTPDRVTIDPAAFSVYAELVQRVRSRGVTIVRVAPPVYYDRWRLAKSDYDRYYAQMGTLFRKDDPSIDFNTPEFDRFRKRRDTFSDGVHMTKTGVDFAMSAIDASLSRCCDHKLSAQSNSVNSVKESR